MNSSQLRRKFNRDRLLQKRKEILTERQIAGDRLLSAFSVYYYSPTIANCEQLLLRIGQLNAIELRLGLNNWMFVLMSKY